MQETTTGATTDFISGGGEMGKLIRSKDWSKTPLGSLDNWPQSLRTAVSICIASNFPICIIWGKQSVQLYNDGYWPITGDMHPKSMGQDFSACWHSAWPVIGQAFEEALLGETRFLETQRIFLERYGYKEETFFTFSFSPILDESGSVGGLFHPVIEQTQQTLAERRLHILNTIPNCTVDARTTKEASALIIDCLKDFELDLPFVLLYSLEADGNQAILHGNVGVDSNSPLAPASISLKENTLKSWPLNQVILNEKAVLVEELTDLFGPFICGPYAEPPTQALVFPVILPGAAHNNYVMIAGVSSRRMLDEKYRLFYELLTTTVTNVLNKARAYDEERKKAEVLAEIDKAKTVFFSNISHEFRTPLTLMLSPLEELLNKQKNNFSDYEKNNIETTHRNAMRLLKLVNTLLDFSRIESGREQAMFSLVDIVSLTKNLAANFRSVIEKAGLKLIIKADTVVKPVYVDKQMWEKIVFNLLSNAFKYTLKGSIIVELTAEKEFVVLKIKDTGVGIPENELPKMFQRFHRVQNVTGRTYEGTGIGLSLIKELVLMHQGTISVESVLNKGSIFTVKIPFGKQHLSEERVSKTADNVNEVYSNIYIDEAETLNHIAGAGTENSAVEQNKLQLPIILIVDDNADMRQHIRSVLSSHFYVITANDGADALNKMKESMPALVLSDIMMPVMDGITLLKKIKENKSTANIPVILLTARAGEESKIEGLKTGADDYLVKPFSANELLARLQAQINIVKLRQSLENNVRNLFMEAPALICVLRGPLHVYELANEMYMQLVGNRDIIGKPVREALPELEGSGIYEMLDQVYLTGEPFIGKEIPAKLDRGNSKQEESYFNFVYQPSFSSEGVLDGILVHGVDVTEQVDSRKKIEENEKRQAFLLKLSDTLRPLSNSLDIEETVTKILREFMDADRCHYSTIDGDHVIILQDAVRGDLPSVAGVHSISNFALYKAVLNAGHPFVVDDVHTSDILDEDLKEVCLLFQYGSFINVPIIKNGKSVGLFSLIQSKPRKWTDLEVQITIETAERTWGAVERAKTAVALSKSEEKYRMLFDSIDEGVSTLEIIFDEHDKAVDFRFLESNPAMTKMTGLTSEIHGKTAKEVLPNIENFWLEAYEGVVKTGEPIRFERYLKDLGYNWFDVHASRVGGVHSRKVITVYNNITERKKAEDKIKDSEQRFRSLADQAPIIVYIVEPDASATMSYFNETWLTYTGQSFEAAIGRAWDGIVHPDDLQEVFDLYVPAFEARQSYTLPAVRLKRYDGEFRWHLFKGNPRYLPNGDFNGYIGVAFDIHEQKLTEEAIEESEERFRSLAHTLPQLVWVTNEQGNPEFASVRWKEYSGIEPGGEAQWKAIVHPDDYEGINTAWIKSLATGSIYRYDVRLKSKEGEYRWHNVNGEPVLDKENNIIKWVGAFTDIHEQKMNDERKDEFIGIASHEMKTPLTTAKGYLQMLELTVDENNEEATQYTKKANESISRLNDLISELLDVSKIRLGKLDYRITAFDFNDMVEDTVENLQLTCLTHTIIKTGKVPDIITGDKDRLQQVVINLLNNAIKYSPGTNEVFVHVEQQNSTIQVSVKDTGIGISEQSLHKIFDKYHRIEEHAVHFQGLGIGLFISYEIIQRHQGKLWAESKPGEGSVFYFTIPVNYVVAMK